MVLPEGVYERLPVFYNGAALCVAWVLPSAILSAFLLFGAASLITGWRLEDRVRRASVLYRHGR